MTHIDLNPEHFLHYEILGDENAHKTICLLHGIMGKSSNLISFTKKLLHNISDTKAILFDLRNHGQSSKNNTPATVQAAADDIVFALNKLKLQPHAIIGHSFGSKVALLAAMKMPYLQSAWILDASLSKYEPQKTSATNFEAMKVLKALEEIPWPLSSRKELVDHLMSKNIEKNVALWMTTNLKEENQKLFLNFYPKEIEKMLESFLKLDLWQEAQLLSKRCRVYFVAAQYSNRIDFNEENKMKNYLPNYALYTLPNAGHFLHSDNPGGLVNIMKQYL